MNRRLLQRRFSTSNGIRPHLVIVGSGWAGFRLATDLDKKKFQGMPAYD